MRILKPTIFTLLFTAVFLIGTTEIAQETSYAATADIVAQNMQKVEKPKPKKKEYVKLPSQEDNSFKTYMDFEAITNKSSRQWKYQKKAETDKNGLRKIGKYYCVALGSGFSEKLGAKFKVNMESGESFYVIMIEQKADKHTDKTNKYIDRGGGSINIVEFIVETSKLPDIVRVMGDVSHMPSGKFAGNIKSIERL